MSRRRLTDRQKARIRRLQERRREAAAKRADASLSKAAGDSRPGMVITRHGNNLVIEDADGGLWHCLFRQNIGHVVCGDEVIWQATGEREGVVTALEPRRSLLSRPDFNGREKPLAANITQLIVVVAPEPRPLAYLLDQYLVAAEAIGVRATIALNKSDLLADAGDDPELAHIRTLYPALGYSLIEIGACRKDGLAPLFERLRDHTSILVGQSGVGKSSLVNAVLPDLALQTQRLSDKTGHGRHTTSSTTLYRLPFGGRLIDSPGVRSFRLGHIGKRALEHGFVEFRELLGLCRFSDCTHTHEPGCALRREVEAGRIHPRRLQNLIHMVEHS